MNQHTEEENMDRADLVVADEAGEELVLVGVAEGVVVALVLHELLDALEDELEVVLQLELVHALLLLLAVTGSRHRVVPNQPTLPVEAKSLNQTNQRPPNFPGRNGKKFSTRIRMRRRGHRGRI